MNYITSLIILFVCVFPGYGQAIKPNEEERKALKERLETVFMKDQIFRRMHKDVEEKYGSESKEVAYFWEVVEQQDKVLEKEIVAILEKYGWLGISQVGRLANTTIWAVLQHGSVATKEKYAPLLKASVLKKESQPVHYARLVDRMLINSGKPQLYGTQFEYDSAGKGTFFPVEEPEFINQRRNELGLIGIQEFAKKYGLNWTITQKTSKL
ncbi:hypothetical protein M0D21_00350 [Aquimarina sp. D1M17]|uniref:DUF6624 domain-containing protein n=1 Tax=Aquimarina acroporae TaxID=2937283 RepID=UPI0020C007F5|nr:DUF6624 domain-containing protein [Aquimarina acroporae]MCK8519999.1 hypothetical protein [Aquimarina acroporae]